MWRPSLTGQFVVSFAFILLLALGGITYFASYTFASMFNNAVADDLEVRTALLLPHFSIPIAQGNFEQVNALCKTLGRESGTRITVILPDGKVAGDSEANLELMENHLERPEIQQALSKGSGMSSRRSDTLNRHMLYHAVPLMDEDSLKAFVRTAIPLTALMDAKSSFYRKITLAALSIFVLACALCWMLTTKFLRPIKAIKESAHNIAEGAYTQRLPLPATREFAELALAVNKMAEHLSDRIRTLTRRVNEEEAILLSMVESVLAVDLNEKIISMNRAAGELMGIDVEAAKGESLHAVIRNISMQEFIASTLKSEQPIESEIRIHNPNEMVLQAHGTLLHDGENKTIGALIVMNDITRIRRLEQIRRDFVANVSHELRTPITSIKGFVESLLDGALDSREDTERFLNIIATQSNHLNAIIEDLLTLSRIEQNEESPDSLLQPARLASVIQGAVQLCTNSAQQKNIRMETHSDEAVQLNMNVQLMQQALVNLIDNAIKYSPENQVININSEILNGKIAIRVTDQGIGIPSEHLPRLFERFYRVDRARSRGMGGTGLGLAIVKHIIQIHKGTVEVKSELGKGSTFSILLPLPKGVEENS